MISITKTSTIALHALLLFTGFHAGTSLRGKRMSYHWVTDSDTNGQKKMLSGVNVVDSEKVILANLHDPKRRLKDIWSESEIGEAPRDLKGSKSASTKSPKSKKSKSPKSKKSKSPKSKKSKSPKSSKSKSPKSKKSKSPGKSPKSLARRR